MSVVFDQDPMCECELVGGPCDLCYTLDQRKRQKCREGDTCGFEDCNGCDHYKM